MKLEFKIASAALAAALLCAAAAPSRAEGKWNQNHPRRHEVNRRLNNQNRRVQDGVKDGDLSQKQANQIHREDRGIRREERRMAARDGGHLTKADQRRLNRQENRVSRQINRDERRNDAGNAAPAAAPAPAPASGQ